MGRPRLLIVDACTVIELHEIGLWGAVLATLKVPGREPVRDEASHCQIDGETVPIDLGPDVTVVSVSASQAASFRAQFNPSYVADLHPGEADSLVYLLQTRDFVIC